jgi:hypothetical protein
MAEYYPDADGYDPDFGFVGVGNTGGGAGGQSNDQLTNFFTGFLGKAANTGLDIAGAKFGAKKKKPKSNPLLLIGGAVLVVIVLLFAFMGRGAKAAAVLLLASLLFAGSVRAGECGSRFYVVGQDGGELAFVCASGTHVTPADVSVFLSPVEHCAVVRCERESPKSVAHVKPMAGAETLEVAVEKQVGTATVIIQKNNAEFSGSSIVSLGSFGVIPSPGCIVVNLCGANCECENNDPNNDGQSAFHEASLVTQFRSAVNPLLEL